MTANTESSSNADGSIKADSQQQRNHSGSNSVKSNFSSRVNKKSASPSPQKTAPSRKGPLSVSSFGGYGASSVSSTARQIHFDEANNLDDEILVGDEKEFHDSCLTGNLIVIKDLIKTKIDVNCRNVHDRTPLHLAAGNGHLDIVKVLLQERADIGLSDKFGMDALLWAAWFGHEACVQHLLGAGIKPSTRNKNGFTLLHCCAQNNHYHVIDEISTRLYDLDKDVIDHKGRSCVHIACKHCSFETLERFLKWGCSPVLRDKIGNTPLHVAAEADFPKSLVAFDERHCIHELLNNNFESPLHVAALKGNHTFCSELLTYEDEIDVNIETNDELTPLHYAVMSASCETVEVLLDKGADVDLGDKHNRTPLHFAVARNNSVISRILLSSGAASSIPNARNETPLHIAAENGNIDITEMLLQHCSNPGIKDEKGNTPLNVASRGNYVTIVDMIIKAERYYKAFSINVNKSCKPLESTSFLPDRNLNTRHFRTILYNIAYRKLKPKEWKQLAFFWGFSDIHLIAIEEQYTGSKSFKEHGHRVMLMWLHGAVCSNQNPIKGLYEGLVSIKRKDLAESMRNKATLSNENSPCIIC